MAKLVITRTHVHGIHGNFLQLLISMYKNLSHPEWFDRVLYVILEPIEETKAVPQLSFYTLICHNLRNSNKICLYKRTHVKFLFNRYCPCKKKKKQMNIAWNLCLGTAMDVN